MGGRAGASRTGLYRAILIVASWLLFGCDGYRTPEIYSAEPITARVIEVGTGKPIEGANVLAIWEMKYGLENHGTDYAMVMEASTDSEGKFHLPGWGPRLVFARGALTNATPRFIIFKDGYRLGAGANPISFSLAPSRTKSVWDGGIFTLSKYEGASAEYAEYLQASLIGDLESLFRVGCHGTDFPKFLQAIESQNRQAGSSKQLQRTILQRLDDSFAGKCGPTHPKER